MDPTLIPTFGNDQPLDVFPNPAENVLGAKTGEVGLWPGNAALFSVQLNLRICEPIEHGRARDNTVNQQNR